VKHINAAVTAAGTTKDVDTRRRVFGFGPNSRTAKNIAATAEEAFNDYELQLLSLLQAIDPRSEKNRAELLAGTLPPAYVVDADDAILGEVFLL